MLKTRNKRVKFNLKHNKRVEKPSEVVSIPVTKELIELYTQGVK